MPLIPAQAGIRSCLSVLHAGGGSAFAGTNGRGCVSFKANMFRGGGNYRF